MKKKFVCTVCGYIHEGTEAPAECPVCHAKAEKAFMTDPNVKVFLGNIVSSSVGLTLTISNTVIFNSFSWVAATNKQGEDRVYRLNQTKDVEIIYQVFDDDISKNMFEKVVMKEYIMNEVIKSEQNK